MSAAENMAVDLSLLQSYAGRPVLRFYSWTPHSISLGRFQDAEADLYLDRLSRDRIPWVRRMTGGGAIFHQNEITYSLVCSFEDIGTRSVKESFKTLCSFILESYRHYGLDAAYALDRSEQQSGLGAKTAFCFAGQELYDILVGQKKIGGNAQRRYKDLIFQHGSIPLVQDLDRQLPYFKKTPDTSGFSSLSELLPDYNRHDFQDTLITQFEKILGVRLSSETLNSPERDLSFHLEQEIFCRESWNRDAQIPEGRTV